MQPDMIARADLRQTWRATSAASGASIYLLRRFKHQSLSLGDCRTHALQLRSPSSRWTAHCFGHPRFSIHIGCVRIHSDACPSISGTHWNGPMLFSSLRCCYGTAITSHLHTPLPLCLRAALSEFATRNVLIYLPVSIHLSLVVSCVLPSRLTPFFFFLLICSGSLQR